VYTPRVKVTDSLNVSGAATFQVNNSAVAVTPPSNQGTTEGTLTLVSLGSLSDANSGPWNVTVVWDDGTLNTAFVTTSTGSLGGALHSYAEEGTYTVTVTVTNNANKSGSATFSVIVSELNVAGMPATVSPVAGAPYGGAVATFTDPGTAEANDGTHYTLSINWGDGSASATGMISFSGGTFTASGTHTYAAAGNYTVVATVNHEGNITTVQDTVTVSSLGQFVPAQMVKPVSFWEGLQGQQLVRSFGLTSGGQTLGQWLASTYPKLYGGSNGAPNLGPFTDGQIGGYYQSLFLASKGQGLDAEVLATALEQFATTSSLGGAAGQNFGYTVNDDGLGAYSWNVGTSGQAFGVPNLTILDVYQILLAANNNGAGGEPWDSNVTLRNQASAVFHAINGG
jgi:PKD repeat protein